MSMMMLHVSERLIGRNDRRTVINESLPRGDGDDGIVGIKQGYESEQKS